MHVICDPSSGFKYIVTPSPESNFICDYKKLLIDNNINTIVRLCEKYESSYDDNFFTSSNINIIDIPLKDGNVPDSDTIKQWLNIIENQQYGIAVHCKAGLGRAPLFACIGLIKIGKIDDIGAIELVRKHIKGSLNSKQIYFLCNDLKTCEYKRKKSQGCIVS